jgi:hypothetical protein
MSMMIESMEDLLVLLKKMDMKVTNVDELQRLLATINANYNPDAARQKIGKLIGTTVPGYMAGAAVAASLFTAGTSVGALALIWGAVALVSTAAVISAAIITSIGRSRTLPDTPPNRSASREGPMVTHITKDLSL